MIVKGAGRALARASTVAIRYSAVRRQFADPLASRSDRLFWKGRVGGPTVVDGTTDEDSEITESAANSLAPLPETAVLDYSIQQHRLLTVVARSIAFHLMGKKMFKMFLNLVKGMKSGDLKDLPEVHATSSGLKSLTTTVAIEGIEECRRACGGVSFIFYYYFFFPPIF